MMDDRLTEAQTIWRQLNNAIINRPGLAEKMKKNRLKQEAKT
jgi:hypothetical protein